MSLRLILSPRPPAAGLSTVRLRRSNARGMGGSSATGQPDRARRMPMKRGLAQMKLLIVFLALTLLLTLGKACTCDSTLTWDSHYDKANVILLGTCVDISPNAIKGGLNVVLQVDSSWKREIEKVTTVHTNSPNQCGFPFQRGQRYIVFGNKRHQTIETSACEPNQNFADNGLLTLRRLGQGHAPGREGFARNMNGVLILLGITGLLFLGFVVLRKHLRKARALD
jgi:hypothetical protein